MVKRLSGWWNPEQKRNWGSTNGIHQEFWEKGSRSTTCVSEDDFRPKKRQKGKQCSWVTKQKAFSFVRETLWFSLNGNISLLPWIISWNFNPIYFCQAIALWRQSYCWLMVYHKLFTISQHCRSTNSCSFETLEIIIMLKNKNTLCHHLFSSFLERI